MVLTAAEVVPTGGIGVNRATRIDLDVVLDRVKTHETSLLDEYTLRIIRRVLSRAARGWPDKELRAYLAYEKRCANGHHERESVRRVVRAAFAVYPDGEPIDRWGLSTAIAGCRANYDRAVDSLRQTIDAREAFEETMRDGETALRNRGGGGSSTKNKSKPKPKTARWYEVDREAAE